MLASKGICQRLLTVSALSLLACCLIGCEKIQTGNAGPSGPMATVGGIFWPDVTPGYDTETCTEAALSIPVGSVCDVRVHPGAEAGRAMAKVLVKQQWHVVWVDQIASRDYQTIHFLPFDTFPYVSCGSEDNPDGDWDHSERRLILAADVRRKELSDEALRSLYGEKTVEAYHPKP